MNYLFSSAPILQPCLPLGMDTQVLHSRLYKILIFSFLQSSAIMLPVHFFCSWSTESCCYSNKLILTLENNHCTSYVIIPPVPRPDCPSLLSNLHTVRRLASSSIKFLYAHHVSYGMDNKVVLQHF